VGIFADAVSGWTGAKAHAGGGWDAWDDRWYTGDLTTMGAYPGGTAVSAETMLNCGVVLAAVRFRANIFSQAQPSVFRQLKVGREDVPDSPVRAVLRDPCTWLTGVRWRHLQMMWGQTWGNAYSEIIFGRGATAEELRPINPGLVSVAEQRNDGSLVYQIQPGKIGDTPRRLGQENLLHFRGPSMNGVTGLPMYSIIRNAIGIAMLAEKHTSMSLKKGSRLAGLLIPKGDIGSDDPEKGRKLLADSVNKAFGGVENTGTMGVLPYEVDFKPMAQTNVEAQLIELRDWQVGDLLRFLDVPGVVVGYGEKTATFASADAFFEEARRCVLPWVVNFEAEEEKALLTRGGGLQIKHNLDAVLRADTATRYEALFKAAGRAWLTGNEVREIEDYNPITDDDSMDTVAPPPNTNGSTPSGDPGSEAPPKQLGPPPTRPKPTATMSDPLATPEALNWQFAYADAERTVRREVLSIKGSKGAPGAAQRFASKPDAWKAWAASYYEKHAVFVASLGRMTEATAREYCQGQRDALLAGGVGVVETWEETAVPRLASLILGA
jgi:HK97 family phage portal protein